ncbi:hypothetical protein [Sphingopyxis sp.]|uniref:hypothetical protein n=1 Tax=Sphingopyxis sp. TaxID=1908224 RepID=UPI0025F095CD|nr:hypothetical protein [Sphingopyxis sp.]
MLADRSTSRSPSQFASASLCRDIGKPSDSWPSICRRDTAAGAKCPATVPPLPAPCSIAAGTDNDIPHDRPRRQIEDCLAHIGPHAQIFAARPAAQGQQQILVPRPIGIEIGIARIDGPLDSRDVDPAFQKIVGPAARPVDAETRLPAPDAAIQRQRGPERRDLVDRAKRAQAVEGPRQYDIIGEGRRGMSGRDDDRRHGQTALPLGTAPVRVEREGSRKSPDRAREAEAENRSPPRRSQCLEAMGIDRMADVRGPREIVEAGVARRAGRNGGHGHGHAGGETECGIDLASAGRRNEAHAIEEAPTPRKIASGFEKGAVGIDPRLDVPAGIAIDRRAHRRQRTAILSAGRREIKAGIDVEARKALLENQIDDAPARLLSVSRRRFRFQNRQPLQRLGRIGQDRPIKADRLAVDQDHRLRAACIDERGKARQQILHAIRAMARDLILLELGFRGDLGFAAPTGRDDDLVAPARHRVGFGTGPRLASRCGQFRGGRPVGFGNRRHAMRGGRRRSE